MRVAEEGVEGVEAEASVFMQLEASDGMVGVECAVTEEVK